MTANDDRARGCGAGLLMATPSPARFDEVGRTIKRGLYDEAALTVHPRCSCMDRTNPTLPNNVARERVGVSRGSTPAG